MAILAKSSCLRVSPSGFGGSGSESESEVPSPDFERQRNWFLEMECLEALNRTWKFGVRDV